MTGHYRALEESYLDHLLIYAAVENPDSSLFGTLVDSWHAYFRGGLFVKNKTGTPRTFENPTGRLELAAMREMHWISDAAWSALHGGPIVRMVKDHSVPRVELRRLMLAERGSIRSRAQMRDFLAAWYRLGALTHEEHNFILPRANVRDCMPDDWDRVDHFARYRAASIMGRALGTDLR